MQNEAARAEWGVGLPTAPPSDGGQWLFLDCSLWVIYVKNVVLEERILSITEQMVSIGEESQGQVLDKFRMHNKNI